MLHLTMQATQKVGVRWASGTAIFNQHGLQEIRLSGLIDALSNDGQRQGRHAFQPNRLDEIADGGTERVIQTRQLLQHSVTKQPVGCTMWGLMDPI